MDRKRLLNTKKGDKFTLLSWPPDPKWNRPVESTGKTRLLDGFCCTEYQVIDLETDEEYWMIGESWIEDLK